MMGLPPQRSRAIVHPRGGQTMKTCNEVMTKNPTCCLATDPVNSAAEIMKNEDVGSVPVIESHDNPRLVGVITDRDIVLRVVADDRDYHSVKIQDVMSVNPVTCSPDDAFQDAADKMAQHQVRRLPIVDGKQHVIGIIALADMATRVTKPKRTAEVLEEISQPVG
jgi:CBS domain-containing protein